MAATQGRETRTPRSFDLFSSPKSPLSMFMRKDGQGRLLGWSSLRVIVFGEFLAFCFTEPATWTMPAVYAMLVPPAVLVADALAAMIPVPQLLAAVQAGAGYVVQRVQAKAGEATSSVTVETTTTPAAPAGERPGMVS